MAPVQFPASAANSLIEGYCDDFVSFAAILAQTLEQISMRGIDFSRSRPQLERLERGMRQLSDAIADLLAGRSVAAPGGAVAEPEAAAPPAPTAPRPQPRPKAPPPRRRPPAPRSLVQQRVGGDGPNLKGNNQSMPLLSVSQFLGRTRKSGIMHVRIIDEVVTFEFREGHIQHTTSSGCPANERIGEILVSMRFCTEQDLERLLQSAASSSLPLGELILESGVVSQGQLLEALERQVQLRFTRACKTALASYWFEEGVCAPTDGRVRISPFELEWEQKRKIR